MADAKFIESTSVCEIATHVYKQANFLQGVLDDLYVSMFGKSPEHEDRPDPETTSIHDVLVYTKETLYRVNADMCALVAKVGSPLTQENVRRSTTKPKEPIYGVQKCEKCDSCKDDSTVKTDDATLVTVVAVDSVAPEGEAVQAVEAKVIPVRRKPRNKTTT